MQGIPLQPNVNSAGQGSGKGGEMATDENIEMDASKIPVLLSVPTAILN